MLKKDSAKEKSIIPIEVVTQRIFFIRGQKVMLDADLAEFYGVATKRLNEQVKRDKDRFPEDFMIQLTNDEKQEVVANCDHLSGLSFSYHLPIAFTEHGVAMLASVLKSKRAIEMSVFIVRTFIKLRKIIALNKDIEEKIIEFEREQKLQNKHINSIYTMLDKLINEPIKPTKKIGFERD